MDKITTKASSLLASLVVKLETSPQAHDQSAASSFKVMEQQLKHPKCTVYHVATIYRNIGMFFYSRKRFVEAGSSFGNTIQLFKIAYQSACGASPTHKSGLLASSTTSNLNNLEDIQKKIWTTQITLAQCSINLSRIDTHPLTAISHLRKANLILTSLCTELDHTLQTE